MRIIDDFGLDPVLAAAFYRGMNSHPTHEDLKSNCSCTELLNPPQQTILRWRNKDKIERVMSECFAMLSGTAHHDYIHDSFNKLPNKDEIGLSEFPMRIDVLGWTVTGTTDLILWTNRAKRTIKIRDYKTVHEFAGGTQSGWEKYEKQLNIYAYMALQQGMVLEGDKECKPLSIVELYRGWSKGMAGKAINSRGGAKIGSHPKLPFGRIEFDPWPYEKTQTYIEDRVRLLQDALGRDDSNLPVCSEDERNFAGSTAPNKVCNDYCDVAPFCKQYKGLHGGE